MAVNFSEGIFKYTTIPDSKTAKIGNAIDKETCNSGILDVNYSHPVKIPEYAYHDNVKYEIVEIGISAFRYCRYIPKVTIPPTIITINYWAFNWLISCKEFVFLPGSKLTTIVSGAFSRCYSITTLVLPNTVRSISDYGLAYLGSLKTLYICGNPSISEDIFWDTVKDEGDVVAPSDLQIYVPFEFTGTSTYRNFTKTYFNKVCDFTIKCKTCFDCTLDLHLATLFTIIFISV